MSMAADHTRRWSDVVPPESALSFAAIWDPEDGLVTFSGPELLNAESLDGLTRDVPWDATEGRSQILTIDGLTFPFSSLLDLSGLPRGQRVQFTASALDEGQSVLDPYMRYFEARRQILEQTTDAEKAKRRVGHIDWSHLRNASAAVASLGNRILRPFTIAPPDDGSEHTYEEFFEEVPVTARTSTTAPLLVQLNLKSSFSVTTTSTTGYVDIDTPSEYSQGDSETWYSLRDAEYQSCPNRPMDTRRRLRKPRPVAGDAAPASPDEVLARSEFNHASGSSPTPSAARPVEGLAKGLKRFRSLPKIHVKTSRNFRTPSPTSSADTDKVLPPLPPLPTLPSLPPPPPSSPARSGSGSHTLKTQRSMTKLVREGVVKLAKCYERTPVAWKHEIVDHPCV